jgi:hypothetical protein
MGIVVTLCFERYADNAELSLIFLIWGSKKVCNLSQQEPCLKELKLYIFDHLYPMPILRRE